MREGLRARDIKILGLKQRVDEITFERDTLQGKLASVDHHLQDARVDSSKYKDLHTESVVALSTAKSEADAFISSYREDVAVTNARAKKLSEEVELELTRFLEHARFISRRKALEDVRARGIDLSNEIKRVKALEEESAALLSSDDGSASGSSSGSEDDEDEGEVPGGRRPLMFQGSRAKPLKAKLLRELHPVK